MTGVHLSPISVVSDVACDVVSLVVCDVVSDVVDCSCLRCLVDCCATGACGGTGPYQGGHCGGADKGCCPSNRPAGCE